MPTLSPATERRGRQHPKSETLSLGSGFKVHTGPRRSHPRSCFAPSSLAFVCHVASPCFSSGVDLVPPPSPWPLIGQQPIWERTPAPDVGTVCRTVPLSPSVAFLFLIIPALNTHVTPVSTPTLNLGYIWHRTCLRRAPSESCPIQSLATPREGGD